jgi:hypothetical protein
VAQFADTIEDLIGENWPTDPKTRKEVSLSGVLHAVVVTALKMMEEPPPETWPQPSKKIMRKSQRMRILAAKCLVLFRCAHQSLGQSWNLN